MGNRWSRRQDQTSGSSGALRPLATGATVAAGLYSAWRLYQTYFTQNQGANENSKPTAGQSSRKLNISFNSSDDSGIENTEDGTDAVQSLTSPGELLSFYFENNVQKKPTDLNKAKAVVKEVTEIFFHFLKSQSTKIHIHSMNPFGSAYEETNVTEEYDVLVQIDLEDNMWNLVPGSDTFMSAPGYWLIQRENQDFFAKGCSVWDAYLTGGYLSPVKVSQMLQGKLQQGISWTSNYNLHPYLTGSKIVVSVEYGDGKYLDITFVPCVHFKGNWVTARRHPQAALDATFQNFWQQSFYEQERQLLLEDVTATSEGNCKCQCLQLMKYLRLRNPYFKSLDSYVFKTILLHLIDDEEKWSREDMLDRLVDFLKMMEHHIRLKSLPNYFLQDVNLFSDYSEEDIWAVHTYLQSLLRKKQIRLLSALLY